MTKRIKIYGERNTNTNYLGELLALNLDVQQIPGVVPKRVLELQRSLPGRELVRDIYFWLTFGGNLGWKHAEAPSAARIRKQAIFKEGSTHFLTLTKNPYSWLVSLHRNPYHQYYSEKPDFETFLTLPWKTVGRDRSSKILASPMELWNRKNASYLDLQDLGVLHLRTEDLFRDAVGTVDRISDHFAIPKVSLDFVDFHPSTKGKDSAKDGDYYRDYYLNERWRAEISGHALAIINRSLDRGLLRQFGYELMPEED